VHEGALPQPSSLREILADPALRVIMLVVFVIMLGFGIVAPVLPLFARSFGVGYGAAGLLISAFAFTRLGFDLFAGPLVDRWGEQRASIAALLFVAVSSFLTALAPNFALAVIFRGAGGAGSSLLFAALYSYLLKVVPRERMARAAGLFYGAFNFGVIAGSPLGGLIAGQFNLKAPLYFYSGILVVAAVLYRRYVPDPVRKVETAARKTAGARYKALLRESSFWRVALANLAYLWMVSAVFDTLTPLFARDHLHLSPTIIGAIYSVGLATEMLVLYPAGAAADRVGRKPVAVLTYAWLIAIVSVLGLTSSTLIFFLLFAALGTASGSSGVIPTAMLADVVPDEASGTAVGVFRFAGDVGLTLGPLVAGFTANAVGFKASFGIAVIPCFIALLMLAQMPETLKRSG
jgi:MFS transporter, DHA1 family, multidrug resistance protein